MRTIVDVDVPRHLGVKSPPEKKTKEGVNRHFQGKLAKHK